MRKTMGCLLILVGVVPWVYLYGAANGLFPMLSYDPNADYDAINNVFRCLLVVGIGLAIWGLILFFSGSGSKSTSSTSLPGSVTPFLSKPSSQQKQASSHVPLLTSQTLGYKEEQSMNTSQNKKEQANAYCEEGKRLYKQEREREAIRAFNKALEYDPFLLDALIGKTFAHAVLGEDEQALRTAERVFSVDPNAVTPLRVVAKIYWERRDYRRAWESVNRLLTLAPKDSNGLFIKAAILEDEGRLREASEILNLIPEDDPLNELVVEWQVALRKRIHDERVAKTADGIKFVGGIVGNVGKVMAQDLLVPNCVHCGTELTLGQKICPVCKKVR